MIVGTARGSIVGLLAWQWRKLVLYVACASTIAFLRNYLEWAWLEIHPAPLTIVGGAIAIFVGFRTNSAYDRWWEGRRLWGQLVNSSRMLTTQVLAYLPASEPGAPTEPQRRLITRHLVWVHVLRCRLRDQDPWADPRIRDLLSEDERAQLADQSSPNHALIDRSLVELERMASAGEISELRLQSLDRTYATLLDVQGGCERIKKTPMPRGYGFIADRLIMIYGIVFPLALADDLALWVVPLDVLVCMAFLLISEVGRVLEDPFTMFYNGLPLTQLSAMIEANVRERMGDRSAPPVPIPDARGILM
jgi:ion channel-forming bestrophin family protein